MNSLCLVLAIVYASSVSADVEQKLVSTPTVLSSSTPYTSSYSTPLTAQYTPYTAQQISTPYIQQYPQVYDATHGASVLPQKHNQLAHSYQTFSIYTDHPSPAVYRHSDVVGGNIPSSHITSAPLATYNAPSPVVSYGNVPAIPGPAAYNTPYGLGYTNAPTSLGYNGYTLNGAPNQLAYGAIPSSAYPNYV